jgi:hypothetical protein
MATGGLVLNVAALGCWTVAAAALRSDASPG